MKKLLLALALFLIPASASAQCTGVFAANTVCGRGSAEAAGNPHQVPGTSIAVGLVVGTTTITGGSNSATYQTFLTNANGILANGHIVDIGPGIVTVVGRSNNFNVYPLNTSNGPQLGYGTGAGNGEGGSLTFYTKNSGGAATNINQELGFVQVCAWNGSAYCSTAPPALVWITTEAWTLTNNGAGNLFQATTRGQTTARGEACIAEGLTVAFMSGSCTVGLGIGTINSGAGTYDTSVRVLSSVNPTMTNNQNNPTSLTVNNNSTGTVASSSFTAGNSANVAQFGIGGTGNTALSSLIQNKAFIYSSTGAGGMVLYADGASHPINFILNGVEVGRWDSTTVGQLTLGLAGTTVGKVAFTNATSGSITFTPVTGALGSIAIAVPATSGTLATTATSPITLNATTGVVACATCVTSSGGGSITGTAPISVSAAGVVSLDNAGVTYAKIQNLGALAVMGRSANSSGVGADIQATAASDAVLRESGSTIGFGTIATAGIANNAVTLAKLATQATNTVLANATSGAAVPTAFSMPSCSDTGGNHLNWVTNTGFTCGTSAGLAGSISVGVTTVANGGTNRILYQASAGGLLSAITTANSSVLVTDSGGIPSLSTTLPAHAVTTSVTVPLVIGGAGTTGTQLTLKTTTGNGTTDQMVFVGGNNGATTIATFIGGTATAVGFGSAAGAAVPTNTQMVISRNATTVDAAISGLTVMQHIVGGTGEIATQVMDTFGAIFPVIAFRAAGGTAASKTALASGNRMGSFLAYGWDTAAYGGGPLIAFYAGETFSATAHGSYIDFQTVALTTTTQQVNMRLQGSGGLSIGNAIIATDPGQGGLIANGATIRFTALASDTATVDNTVCVSGTGLLLKGSGALGVCLGTSGEQFKTAFAPMVAGVDELMKIDFKNYRYRLGYGDSGARLQYGTTAQNVEAVLPDLVGHDASGRAINYDSGALIFIGLRAIQQLKADNDNLRLELSRRKG